MTKTFRCAHCKKRKSVNRRLKGTQRYCGSAACQQARKNVWERERLQKDPDYQSKRKASKDKWRSKRPSHEYQRQYRESHPEYVAKNRERQKFRNASVLQDKIVKTDALNRESLVVSGLYALIPYNTDTKKNIVRTDAIIVQLSNIQNNTTHFLNNSS